MNLLKFYKPYDVQQETVDRQEMYKNIENTLLALKFEEVLDQTKFSRLHLVAMMSFSRIPTDNPESDLIPVDVANEWLSEMNQRITLEILRHNP
jgi:hypothetical protein